MSEPGTGQAFNDRQALFMNSGILMSDLVKVEISIFPISGCKEERQVSWVRFCHQG